LSFTHKLKQNEDIEKEIVQEVALEEANVDDVVRV
tara:strand:+ start:220 stop:324 length:105 start_codon:yes stop_codon:yes gene_type:complete